MNCAVSTRLLSVCHCCFTPLFLGHTCPGSCSFSLTTLKDTLVALFSLVLVLFPLLSFRLPICCLWDSVFLSSIRTCRDEFPCVPWHYESVFDLLSAMSLMPAGVLADIPICLLRHGIFRLLPIAFCQIYIALMHGIRCGVTQSVGSQSHFGSHQRISSSTIFLTRTGSSSSSSMRG